MTRRQDIVDLETSHESVWKCGVYISFEWLFKDCCGFDLMIKWRMLGYPNFKYPNFDTIPYLLFL